MIQNALKGISQGGAKTLYYGTSQREGLTGQGSRVNLIHFGDNGSGMSPMTVASKLFPLYETGPEVGDPGGYGIAKAGIFGIPDRFEMRTFFKDPRTGKIIKTTLKGNKAGYNELQLQALTSGLMDLIYLERWIIQTLLKSMIILFSM